MAVPRIDVNALIARQIGVDWIKVIDVRWLTGDPDLVIENDKGRKENFWSPEVRWSVGGKEYAAVIPIKTKVRNWRVVSGFDIFNPEYHFSHEMDLALMLEELASIVRPTIAIRAA